MRAQDYAAKEDDAAPRKCYQAQNAGIMGIRSQSKQPRTGVLGWSEQKGKGKAVSLLLIRAISHYAECVCVAILRVELSDDQAVQGVGPARANSRQWWQICGACGRQRARRSR
jgi:hypothetical protein